MKAKYRIQINELNNGVKEYIPQIGYVKMSFGFTIDVYTSWENIIIDGVRDFNTSPNITPLYKTEEEAMGVIEKYKEYSKVLESKKVNNIKFKELNKK